MKNLLRTALLGSAAVACVALPNSAFAQTQPAPKAAVDVDEIVVTGSRIRRSDLTSVQPIQIITTETIDERGFTNVADALNELPSSGIPINPIGDQGSFGTGRNFINIFNLGTNRTLTLVNGRRFVGGNAGSIFSGAPAGGQVDLNAIPTGLVERIETIQASGGAVYGSDAIAGVINIITKREYDGVEIDGRYGISDKGDAEGYRARITAGRNFLDNRLNLSGSYEYDKTSQLAFTDRDVTSRQIAFAANPQNTSGSDGIPGSILIFNRRIPEVTLGGLPSRAGGAALSGILTMPDPANPGQRIAAQFGPGGTLIPFKTGTFYQASVASGGDGLNLAELAALQSPVERHVFTGFAKYDFTDKVRVTGELFYSTLDSVEPFNQPIYNAPLFGGNSAALRFSTANPFLSAATRATLLAQPTALTPDAASPGDGVFFLSRASTDIGTNKTTAEGDTLRVVVNLEGEFDLMGRDYAWNISANRGRSQGNFKSPNIDQSRFVQAIDAVRDASGAVVCRDATARAAGCAPLNMFGFGSPSAAALAYIQVQFQSDFELVQTVYEGNLNGALFDLPAGPVKGSVGFEYRKEESDFSPNNPQRLGIGRSAAITALQGEFDTKELAAELLVPIFGGDFTLPFFNSLEVEGSYRKIDHSQAGKDKAWTYGLRWKPVADLMLRAQKSRSFRAPAITEVNLPTATSFVSAAVDPCDFRNIASGPSPANRTANCRAAFTALGLPATFSLTSQIQVATAQGATSGNPNLVNEIAEQWSAGFVYQPSFAPGLAVSFDWVNIDLTNAIGNFNLGAILQVCYDSPTPPVDTCNRFLRGTAAAARPGQILTNGESNGAGVTSIGPQTGFVNAGYTNFQGFTLGLDYRVDLGDLSDMRDWLGGNPGSLGFSLDLFHVNKQETSVTGLGFDLNDDKNEIGNSDLQWNLESTYKRDPFSVIWTVNYIGQSEFNNDFTLETRLPLKVDSYMVHDLAFSYKLDSLVENWGMGLDNMTARFIVRNVADVEAPFGTTGLGTYDVLGRYYQVGLTARF
ncbi:TonB-dependent receptor domain-containing protein [Phenylobacterium sp.]|uniref:TonB-dependent receptor domain-containing protein n=1 Tax=Phenylobacterium sp. TaxID=1871053 RepID=UPI0027333BC4|nr:TonB-dependent receptor [Phenylobacterium sp.]MDP3854087.1 TonB-dependent receptor [Phenylobacterium sp.]